jgi:hypothetical protein
MLVDWRNTSQRPDPNPFRRGANGDKRGVLHNNKIAIRKSKRKRVRKTKRGDDNTLSLAAAYSANWP